MTIQRWDTFRQVGGLPAERLYEFTTYAQLLFSQGVFLTAGEDIPAMSAVSIRAADGGTALYKTTLRDTMCAGLTVVDALAASPVFVFASGRVWMPSAAFTPGRALYVVPEVSGSNVAQSVPLCGYGDYLHTLGIADTENSLILRFHSLRFGGI